MQDRGASQLVGRTKFVGGDDSIILEDESARMRLRGESLPVGQLVTGVVMAVRGVAAPGGDFQVNVWCCHTYSSVSPASQSVCYIVYNVVEGSNITLMKDESALTVVVQWCWLTQRLQAQSTSMMHEGTWATSCCTQCLKWCRRTVLQPWLLKCPGHP